MTIPVIQIGNSKGIRIPQAVLKQCGAAEKFELTMKEGAMVLTPLQNESYELSFSNIARMNDMGIQSMLRKLDPFTVAVSLIGAEEEISARVYQNLSRRAYESIKEEVDRLSSLSSRELIVEMHRARINSVLRDIETV